jgi:hypothetical protein
LNHDYRANYLVPIVPIGLLETFSLTFPEVALSTRTIGSFTVEGLLAIALTAFAFLLWLRFRPCMSWCPVVNVMIWSLICLWLITNFGSLYYASYWFWSQASVVFPAILFMILLKRPTYRDTKKALDLLAFLIIITFAIRLALDLYSQELTPMNLMNLVDSSSSDFRGYRWDGLAGNPNTGGPLGAFLILYGSIRKGKTRIVLIAVGAFILVVTFSRSVILGLLIALAVMSFYRRKEQLRAGFLGGRWIFIPLAALLAGVVWLFVWRSDFSTFDRFSMWSNQWALLTSNLPETALAGGGEVNAAWLGVGNPHNVFLSLAVHYGIFAVLNGLLIFAVALLIADRLARGGEVLGIGLWIFLALLSVTESQVDWRYLNFATMLLLFIPLLAAGHRTAEAEPSSATSEYSS